MAGMPDQQDRVPVRRVPPRLNVHLGHERAGGVDRVQPACLGVRVDRGRDAVRREHHGLPLGHLSLVLDEDRAASLEVANDVGVVNDLLADVNGRPMQV
jgi:hypothetical protein